MFTVIKLGGCNGSGKTSVAREVMKIVNAQPIPKRQRHNFAYRGFLEIPVVSIPVMVLGRYETACGGMDTISDKEDRFQLLVNSCMPNTIVFMEGLITGKTFGRMGAWLAEQEAKGKCRAIWAFMDTPFNVCVDRVLMRRLAKGNDAPFDPERTMRSTFNSCETLEAKLRDGRLPAPAMVMSLKHKKRPGEIAAGLMTAAGRLHNGC